MIQPVRKKIFVNLYCYYLMYKQRTLRTSSRSDIVTKFSLNLIEWLNNKKIKTIFNFSTFIRHIRGQTFYGSIFLTIFFLLILMYRDVFCDYFFILEIHFVNYLKKNLVSTFDFQWQPLWSANRYFIFTC